MVNSVKRLNFKINEDKILFFCLRKTAFCKEEVNHALTHAGRLIVCELGQIFD